MPGRSYFYLRDGLLLTVDRDRKSFVCGMLILMAEFWTSLQIRA